jgi:uncharacterized membrane protein YidH (DUF202 family)
VHQVAAARAFFAGALAQRKADNVSLAVLLIIFALLIIVYGAVEIWSRRDQTKRRGRHK